MYGAGRQSALGIPGDEHDERVPSGGRQRAIAVILAIDCAQNVRPAVNGQIERAAAIAIDLAPSRVKTAKMGLERGDSLI